MKKIVIGIIIVAALGLAGCAGADAVAKSKTTTKAVVTTEAKPATTSGHAVDANAKTPEEAMNLLKAGNQRFVEDKSTVNNVDAKRRKELEGGQHPYATIISCSDSRVTPALVFNAGLGDIFDIRLAGNIVNDDALGSVEYAVDHLHTPVIVVMGHENCGAVTAAYDQVKKGQEAHGRIEDIVEEIEPAVEKTNTVDEAIRLNVKDVVADVKADPVVAKAIKDGQVKVVGAYYDLDGKVTFNS